MPFIILKDNTGELVINTDQIASISENTLRPAGAPLSYAVHLTNGSSPLDLTPPQYAELKTLLNAEAFPKGAATKLHERMNQV